MLSISHSLERIYKKEPILTGKIFVSLKTPAIFFTSWCVTNLGHTLSKCLFRGSNLNKASLMLAVFAAICLLISKSLTAFSCR